MIPSTQGPLGRRTRRIIRLFLAELPGTFTPTKCPGEPTLSTLWSEVTPLTLRGSVTPLHTLQLDLQVDRSCTVRGTLSSTATHNTSYIYTSPQLVLTSVRCMLRTVITSEIIALGQSFSLRRSWSRSVQRKGHSKAPTFGPPSRSSPSHSSS